MSFEVSFRLTDGYARHTSKTFISDRTLIADVNTDITAMIALLEGASDCVVTQTKVSQVTPIAASASAGVNLDAGGTLHCRLDNGKLYGFKIPAIDPSVVDPDGSLDKTDSKLTDLVAAFASGQHWKVSETNTIGSIEYGELDR